MNKEIKAKNKELEKELIAGGWKLVGYVFGPMERCHYVQGVLEDEYGKGKVRIEKAFDRRGVPFEEGWYSLHLNGIEGPYPWYSLIGYAEKKLE